MTQNNLGNVLGDLGERGERGTRCPVFRAVGGRLSGGPGGQNPRAIAAGLGHDAEQSGHRAPRSGERSERRTSAQYLEQSVAAYRAALEVYTREQLPQDWATTQNNLGIALRDLGGRSERRSRPAVLEQSVAAYRAALEV